MTAEHKAPHEALQNALFVYAAGTDGMGADLIHGWPALVERVVNDVAGDDWEGALCDLDEWLCDYEGTPFRYSVNFEDGFMCIYRLGAEPRAWISATELDALKDGKAAFVTPGGGDGDTPLFGA